MPVAQFVSTAPFCLICGVDRSVIQRHFTNMRWHNNVISWVRMP